MKTTQSFHPVTQSNIMKTILLPACIIAFVLSASAQNITKPNIKGPSGFDVNSYTGNLFFQKDVVSIPDRGLALDLTLTYNSSDIRENKGFGKGWSCEYLAYYTIGKKLTPLQTLVKVLNLACYPVSTPSNADSVTIHWGDGRKDIYRFSGGHYVAPVGIFDQLVQYQTDKYKIISKYGKEYYFDDPGHKSLTKIRDLNGNELNLSYTNSFLSSVMHSSGKSLSFSWNDSCITQVNNSNITPPGNYTFTYQDKKLTGITYPNNGHVSYGYDNSDCLTSFTDENGNITTISYKSSTSVSPVNFVCSPGYWIMMVIPIDRTPQTWTAFYTHTTRAVNRIKTTGTDMSITYDTANNNTIVVRHVVSGNQFTKYSFDAQGRVMKITDNMGYTETLQYDSDNNITKHTDPLGYTTRYVYDDKGNKVQETDANNQSITYSYNTLNRLVSMTDKNNQTTTYSYDSYGNLTHMNLPSNIHETFGYTVGQLSNFLDGKSQNTTYSYVNGYLSSIGHLFGNEYFTTNNIGNVLEKTDPNQHTSYFSYDNMNRLIRRINAAGDSLRYAYDLNGNLTAIRNENGHVTSFTYDPLNRVTAVYSPTGLKSREYDAMGNITKRTNELGHSWKYAYNYQNYPKWEITPENDTTRFSYDAAGNLLGLTDPLGHTTSYQYNHLHLPVTETDAAGLTETYGYDANGNQTMLTDRKGNTTQYTYDALNRLTSVNEPACEANYTYDQNGNLTAIHDGNSHETVYAYNNQDLIASETDALGFTNQYQYDANGNLVIKTDANGNTTTYQYDVLNRLVHKSSGSFFEDYQYDKVGNMTLAANNHISMEFTYDSANRMVSKHILTPGWDKTIHYTYCSCGKRYTMTDPDSGVTTYTYYDDGKIKSLINPENDTISFFYDKAGRLTRQNNANGTHSLYTYDSRNNLLSIYHKTSADSVLQFFEYVYDSNGNRSSMTDNSGINHYYYDGSNQLVKVEYSNGNKEEFVYDRAGNRTQRIMNETKITDYSYDAANRILSSGGTTYTFDKNGSMTQKTDSSGTTHYDYDFNNRLIMIILPSNDTLKYAYDPLGNRISVTDTAGTITRYFYDGVNAIMELDPSGNTMARYTALFEPDSWLEMKRGGANYTYMKDALGSVTGIADLHQNIIKTYNYSSFGELSGQGVSLENPYTFSGREKMNNDCYYFRARFYCPELGRFSSKDLIFGSFKFPNSLVKYLFLRNNPLNFKDPLGLSTDLVGCAKDILDIGNQLFDILPKEFYKEPSGQLSFLKFTEKGIKYPFQEWWGKSTSGKSLFSHLGKVNQGVTALDFAFTNWQVFNGRNLSNLSFMENMDLLHDFGKANLPTLTGILGGAIGTTLGGPLGGLLGGYLGGKLGEWLGNSLDNPPAFQKSNLPDLCSELPNGFNDTKPPLINQGNGNQNGSPGDGTELPAWWLDFPNWLDSLLAGIPLVVPSDPNEIIGPQGYAIPQWVSVKDNLPYTVLFENNPEASGAAQKVVIEVPLGNKVNPYSFRLGDFGFGSFLFQVPSNTTTYSQRLDVADSLGVFVDVTAGLDIINNKAFWIFQAIDTATLLPTTVAEAGFLPVNDSINHRGEGFVNFTIKPIGSAVTGDTLIKQASIVFDINEAMTTNTWKNTIDALPPVSMVNPLPSTSLTATIPIGLSGADDTGGCGIQKYALYYSQNNGPFHLYKEFETGSNATFTGETGSYYRFFSIASDHVGNTEAMKTLAEAFITIDTCAHIQVSANIQQPTCSYNADGSIALSISGGIPPYTYSWGNEIQQTEDSIFNLGTGTYIVTVTDENRCSETDTFAILAPQILFGNAGPDEVISFGTFIELITLVTGGTQPYTYLWQPGTGLDQVNIPDPVASPSVTTQYQLVTTDVNGCISYDTVVVNVIPAGGIMVSGHLTYNNTFQTPMNYAPIKLYKNDSLFAETVSNLAGYYQFPGLFGGNYRLEGNTSKPSGGINATDALLTLLHFAGIQHLQSFPLKAADVNGSGSLNAVDALLILNRFVGTIETFPAGDWLFENPSFTVNNAENITLNFKTLCYGDPNGSYIPGLKTEPSVRLQYEGEMMVREGEEITIPFRIDRDIEPAAISLVITPEAKPVFDSLNASFYPSFKKGILAFNQVNNQLRLAWYGKEATILKSGAIILYLKTQANNQNLNQWLLGTECQLADDQGNIIQNVTLKVPFIRMTEESCWLGDNIPNPAGNSCIIPFYLNGESRVVLTLYDITGHEVKTLLDASLPAGNQQVETDCRSFSAGVYLYKLEVSNNKTWFLKTKRMVIGR